MSFATSLPRPTTTGAAGFGLPLATCISLSVSHSFSPKFGICNNTSLRLKSKAGSGCYEGIHRSQLAASTILEGHTPINPEVESEKIRLIERIRLMFRSMDDGEISVSPYDTAWVALVEDIGGSGGPQFPTSLEWISNNQLDDGSWGDRKFVLYDRILNTLACVVALTTWKMHPNKCEKGLRFISDNIEKLADEDEELMPVGFEIALPSLIDLAKRLCIEIPDNSASIKNIYAKRDSKLKRIPMDLMHKKPTSLLFSLEGMEGLNWDKLLDFQSEGSFLSSPSSTAYALHHTKDELCLEYLLKAVKKFNGGVPNAYPVDMFEHLWSVDRLRRLGISRYFQVEIDECLDYVYRYWTNKGICWARNMCVQDSDDSSMGFRLLRLYGYDVSIDVFKQFEEGGQFCSIPGQMTHAITGMYNLYRASQLMFPQEHILADARNFTANLLHQKRVTNSIVDKWIITKDLPGEVAYALDVPFYASLPRLEARFFLEQYGGDDDVWIGKTLYRMLYVNCNTYLELAKLDYKHCQTVHQLEWNSMQTWYRECNLGEFGLSERSLLLAYYIAASTAFEPEKSSERLAWAITTILVETIMSQELSDEQKREFVDEFVNISIINNQNGGRYKPGNRLVEVLINTVTLMAEGRGTDQQLSNAWKNWLKTWEEGGDLGEAEARLLLHTIHLSSGLDESSFSHPKYQQLLEATSKVCHQLRLFQNLKANDAQGSTSRLVTVTTFQIEAGMQELVKLIFTKTLEDLTSATKQSFFNIARSFYYTAYCPADTIDSHINKVLFEKIV
ncbi:Gly-Xaa carboxypeptidase [Salvia divinorum]|uniref:(-)-kolavenyl diphosphate synthase, chloroplastic n=2 Tax=Salvia divinorum TaxID=28513 RepID=KPS_SALDI|nr:RecName: Full=(-)-kolavenyl diphosphate synthase, chloroplastic; Short=SdKPS; AltName: Full=Clerodienyl diphosphate synthase; AltName: Full=Kolavenyl diphosphate synthase CPS2; Short=SdCPS2; Flags: Precursor [Salvia divinorum]AOZ15895.1 (-)-kolavenyl diphosphate synthase [Salvia divinorum]